METIEQFDPLRVSGPSVKRMVRLRATTPIGRLAGDVVPRTSQLTHMPNKARF